MNKDIPIPPVTGMFGTDSSFWQYKACSDTCSGFRASRRQL